jgi:DNA-binding MarR family transcriptional regulator
MPQPEYLIIAALRTLGAGATMTPKDLNKVLMQNSAGITKTLTRLEKAGFVQRKPNPQDKHSILIALTADGFEITDQTSLAEAKAQRKKSALLSAGDIDKILDVQRLVITMLAD